MNVFSHAGLDGSQGSGGAHLLTAPSHIHARHGTPSSFCSVAQVVKRACLVLAVCATTFAQPPQNHDAQNRADRELALAFSKESAPELVSHYFDLPSIPIFLVHRLISLDDPRVVPALHDAFDRQTRPLSREFIAAALVRLGETDPRYFDYVAGTARDAVNSQLPFGNRTQASVGNDSADGDLRGHKEIRAWTQTHDLPSEDAAWKAAFEIPGAVEALALTADRRSVPILLKALQSPNFLVVREGAFGLARMHETASIGPIIIACERLDPEDRPWAAKSLLYFRSKRAQKAAKSLIVDSTRLPLWRADVNREEAARVEVTNLSEAVQRLDRASVLLYKFGQTIKEADSASAETALKQYVRELGYVRRSLARLSAGKVEDGLAWAVLDRLGAQRSELTQTREYLPSVGNRTVEKAKSLLELTYHMTQQELIQETP